MSDDSISNLKVEVSKLQKELNSTRDLLGSANSIIIRWDKDGIIQFMNDFGLRFFGYSSDELIGQQITTILPKVEKSSGRDLTRLARDIAKNPDQYKSVPNENITKNGRTVWVTWTNTGIFDEQGKVTEILAIGNDVTALKEAEQRHFESKETLDTALENMSDAVFISDNQGTPVHFNQAFATFHKFKDKSEYLGRLADYPKILDVFLPDGERLALDQWVVARALRGETDTNAEFTLLRKDTGEAWVGSYNFGPVFDRQGKIAGTVVVARDITEKKREEEALRESEELLRVTLANIHDPVFITDDEGQYTFICTNATNALGFTVDELSAMGNISGLIGDDLFDVEEMESQGSLANIEKTIADRNGIHRTFLITVKKVAIGGGTRLFTMRDISKRKQAEERLVKQKYYLEKAQELGQIGSWDLDIISNILVWTDENCRIFGVPPGSLVNYEIFIEKVHPEDREYVDREWAAAMRGKPYDIEHRINIAGKLRWVREKAEIAFDSKGTPVSAIGFAQDITERKLLEEHAKENEDRFTSAFEFASIGMAIVSTDGAFIKVNRALCDMLGYREEAILSLTYMDITYPDDLTADNMDNVRKMLCGEINSYQMEKRYIHKQGHLIWCLLSVSLVTDSKNQPIYFISQILDISERKQAEQALLKSNQDLRLAQRIANIGNWSLDPELGVPEWSDEIYRIYERDPEMGPYSLADYKTIFKGEWLEKFTSAIHMAIHEGQPYDLEFKVEFPPDQVKWVHSICEPERKNGSKEYYLKGTIQDITELKHAGEEKRKLEYQLHQAQKIESIGQLAGGVAHDFNNMLGVILGHAELALMKAPADSPFNADLEQISIAARRSADLTRQLLTFARKQIISPKVLDLNTTVGGMLQMLQRLIGENIQLSWNPAASLWPVKVDPSQIDQILANLCVNARDAISGTGKIMIKTANSSIDESYCISHPEVAPGDYVQLTFSDDGKGINKEVQAHVFEPFFTTKGTGEGTGLGLATVHGAVKQNNGLITLYSEPEHGTIFNIYLPRVDTAVEAVPEATPKTLLSGAETVLLVEDDKMLLQLKTSMLERCGYAVLPALTPGIALSRVQQHTSPIHLLVTDVIMPEMNGKELSEKVTALRPEIRIIFMSGYTADIISEQGIVEAGVHFLQKPVSSEALSKKVREVLDTAS